MVMNSGMMFNPPVYAAADSNVHEITVDGDVIDPVNTFRGFGAVTCNNTSRLLMDYKEEHPDKYWEMMELLFNPEKGAGLNHIKWKWAEMSILLPARNRRRCVPRRRG